MTLEASLVELESLSDGFADVGQERLHEIATERAIRAEESLLELAALAADLSIDDIANLGLEPDLNPLLVKAIHRKYGEEAFEELLIRLRDIDFSVENLNFGGDLGNIKGYYFEELVADRLNEGESVGELEPLKGQRAELPDNPDEPGVDLRIINDDGTLNEELSLKANRGMSSVYEALRKHDDIRVVVPSDLEGTAGTADRMLTTDISNAELEDVVRENLDEPRELGELGEGALKDAFDNTLEIAFDAIPVASGLIIIVTEGRAVLMGAAQLDDALKRGAKRLGKALPFTTAGALMTAASVPGIAVTPALLAARLWASRLGNRAAMGEIAKQHADTLTALRPQPV